MKFCKLMSALLSKTSAVWIGRITLRFVNAFKPVYSVTLLKRGKITVRDIMDEVRRWTPGYLEIEGDCVALSEIIADDKLRTKAINMLNAKMKPYRNKDFPPEITTAWLTKLYLRAKGRPEESQTMIEEMRLDLILGWSRNANFKH